jgi:hypothetical protein
MLSKRYGAAFHCKACPRHIMLAALWWVKMITVRELQQYQGTALQKQLLCTQAAGGLTPAVRAHVLM